MLLCGFASCSNIKYTGQLPKQPKQENYSLSNIKKYDIGNLDTSNIFINNQTWNINGTSETKNLFVFLKFGKDGVAFYSDYSNFSFDAQNVLTQTGQYCFYKIDGDEIQLEFYDHLAKHFKIWYGKIRTDEILFYKYRLRVFAGAKGSINFLFKQSTIPYTKPLVWPN